MGKLVSSWYKNKTLPESHIFPPETRPGNLIVPRGKNIPVIDLSEAEGRNRTRIVQQILKAGEEYGFFQVVNHGVPEDLIKEGFEVLEEFFEMPDEDKAILYSEDPTNRCRLSTSGVNYAREKVHLWRDNLKHPCHPDLQDCIQLWPQKPKRYREKVAKFSIEAKKLGSRILEIVAEGLGLERGYFGDKLSESMLLSVNHYPPCPDPSSTLRISKHCDPYLITILHQGGVNGLQVFNNGEWIGVEPLHNAFVVNIGNQLQIISNDKLKSVEHRVVTNSNLARTSAAFFIAPSGDCVVEPAKSLMGDAAAYRGFVFKDFLLHYFPNFKNNQVVMERFRS
ncbi:ethylene-responsive transcription factor 1B-like [Hibiscus syriacus]|uniref:Ethylene-responsive transcription factor 1B-like n=1 Tax=Hibiscus syriacus TaxID=106335 RepID=A0A6A2Z1Q2_HIBSY|nr:hyoscyamine 6-dioxygenase-like [Hibiscus syriacus]KAE8685360.1 ethylene-responsive transcription factor 1B-like [Hibiscus syriacus]